MGAIVQMNRPNPAEWMWYPEGILLPFLEKVMPVSEMQDPAVVAHFLAHFPHYFILGIG